MCNFRNLFGRNLTEKDFSKFRNFRTQSLRHLLSPDSRIKNRRSPLSHHKLHSAHIPYIVSTSPVHKHETMLRRRTNVSAKSDSDVSIARAKQDLDLLLDKLLSPSYASRTEELHSFYQYAANRIEFQRKAKLDTYVGHSSPSFTHACVCVCLSRIKVLCLYAMHIFSFSYSASVLYDVLNFHILNEPLAPLRTLLPPLSEISARKL